MKRVHPMSAAVAAQLMMVHSEKNLTKQVQAIKLLQMGMESDVVTFSKMVRELGGECPILRPTAEDRKLDEKKRKERRKRGLEPTGRREMRLLEPGRAKPQKQLSRQQVYQKLYDDIYEDLRMKLWAAGPKASVGVWGGGATRKRARALARKMAREALSAA